MARTGAQGGMMGGSADYYPDEDMDVSMEAPGCLGTTGGV